MKDLGMLLREEREARGLSLSDLHARTRINVRYLEAIEAGDFAQIPGEVYLKGFLRRYAECVGLDPEAVIEKYRGLLRAQQAALAETDVKTVRHRSPQRNRTGRGVLVILLVALAAVAANQWFLHTHVSKVRPRSAQGPSAVDVKDESEPPVPVAAPGETPIEALPVGSKVAVRIATRETCWLEVFVDGRLQLRGTKPAGETISFAAQQMIQVRFGNPGGVIVTWNGRGVELNGREPVTRVFTAGEPADASATPTSVPAQSGAGAAVVQPRPVDWVSPLSPAVTSGQAATSVHTVTPSQAAPSLQRSAPAQMGGETAAQSVTTTPARDEESVTGQSSPAQPAPSPATN